MCVLNKTKSNCMLASFEICFSIYIVRASLGTTSLRHISDPRVILHEECAKTPCRRFMQIGECQFSENCKYTHYTQNELWILRQESTEAAFLFFCCCYYAIFVVEAWEYQQLQKQLQPPEVPSVESWLAENKSQHSNTDRDFKTVSAVWTYPAQLEMRTDLPPSIRKINPEEFFDGDFAEWGE